MGLALEKLPDWPARMKAEVAAAYLGVSLGSFRARFGRLGVKEGANVLWSRRQLDDLIAKQFSLAQLPAPGESGPPEEDTWADL